jgi:hypothetical protein
MLKINDVLVLIPAYLPDFKMVDFVKDLKKEGFDKIVIVRDGVFYCNDEVFEEVQKLYGCVVLDHNVNLGKGRALKTGFNYVLNNFKDIAGIVMADADGQHLAVDVVKMAESLILNKNSYIIGTRDFSLNSVPLRSLIGNRFACFFFSYLIGAKIYDTQTGLRAFSYENIKKFIKINGEKYDFETNMLLNLKKLDLPIVKVSINTVYIDSNKSSHFNPFFDTIKIAKNIVNYYLPILLILALDSILSGVISIFNNIPVVYNVLVVSFITYFLNLKFNSDLYKYQNNRIVYLFLFFWWLFIAFIFILMILFCKNIIIVKVVGNFIFFLVNIWFHDFFLFNYKKNRSEV